MLVDQQSQLMSDLLFTIHLHGGDDVTWKLPIAFCFQWGAAWPLNGCLENSDLENLDPPWMAEAFHTRFPVSVKS